MRMTFSSAGAEIASTITERCFNFLETAPVRVTGHDGLVGVAHDAEFVPAAEPEFQQPLLQRGDVLVLVDDEVPVLAAHLAGDGLRGVGPLADRLRRERLHEGAAARQHDAGVDAELAAVHRFQFQCVTLQVRVRGLVVLHLGHDRPRCMVGRRQAVPARGRRSNSLRVGDSARVRVWGMAADRGWREKSK